MISQNDMETLLLVAGWIQQSKRHVMREIRERSGTQEIYLIIVRELDRVNGEVARARSQHVEASLTLLDWLTILHIHEWKCASCREKPFQVMFHHPPLQVGGTTSSNCVPLCRGCRSRLRSVNTFRQYAQMPRD